MRSGSFIPAALVLSAFFIARSACADASLEATCAGALMEKEIKTETTTGAPLRRSEFERAVKGVKGLNPGFEIAAADGDLEKLYLDVKAEDAKVARRGLSPELTEYLLRNFGAKYRIEDASPAERAWFYRNGLRAIYIRLARTLKRKWLKEEIGASADGSAQEQILIRVLSSFLSPYSLEDQELSPESAREYMTKRPWHVFNWSLAKAIAGEWVKARGAEPWPLNTMSLREVERWLDESQFSPSAGRLSPDDFGRMARAICSTRTPGNCCDSRPGCLNCPANLRFLTRRSGDE